MYAYVAFNTIAESTHSWIGDVVRLSVGTAVGLSVGTVVCLFVVQLDGLPVVLSLDLCVAHFACLAVCSSVGEPVGLQDGEFVCLSLGACVCQ